jgi:mRNA interferase MazF
MSAASLRRGMVVTVASPGASSGKSRPAEVVQANRWLQLMVDTLFTVPIQALGAVVGELEPELMVDLDLALRGWLELP